MADIFENGLTLGFVTRNLANEYIETLRSKAYKIDIITLDEVMRMANREVDEDWRIKSLHYGYSRKEIYKLKPVRKNGSYLVIFKTPSLMVRDDNGYWTTEREIKKKG